MSFGVICFSRVRTISAMFLKDLNVKKIQIKLTSFPFLIFSDSNRLISRNQKHTQLEQWSKSRELRYMPESQALSYESTTHYLFSSGHHHTIWQCCLANSYLLLSVFSQVMIETSKTRGCLCLPVWVSSRLPHWYRWPSKLTFLGWFCAHSLCWPARAFSTDGARTSSRSAKTGLCWWSVYHLPWAKA